MEQNMKWLEDPYTVKVMEGLAAQHEAAQQKGFNSFSLNIFRFAESIGMSRPSIRKHINILIKEGMLQKDQKEYTLTSTALSLPRFQSSEKGGNDIVEKVEKSNGKVEKDSGKVEKDSDKSGKVETKNGNGTQCTTECTESAQASIKRKTEQSKYHAAIPPALPESLLDRFNRTLLMTRKVCTKRVFEKSFRRPMERLDGTKEAEALRMFMWEDKELFDVSTNPEVIGWFLDLLTIMVADTFGDEEDGVRQLVDGDYDLENQEESFVDVIARSKAFFASRRIEDEDGGDDPGEKGDEGFSESEVYDFWEDNENGGAAKTETAEGDDDEDAEPEEAPRHRVVRHKNTRFIEFSPDEVESIITDYEGENISNSPLQTFIYLVWKMLEDFYYEAYRVENETKKDKKITEMLEHFQLEDALVEPDVFQNALQECYLEVEDVWRNGGFLNYGNQDSDVEIDWSEVDLFDCAEVEHVFKWERMRDGDGGLLLKPSTKGVFNLEAKPVEKPVRVPRALKDPVYQAYNRENMKYVTDLLAADEAGGEEAGKLNELECIIVEFVKEYFIPTDSNVNPGLKVLMMPEGGKKDGVQILDPNGNYMHHERLNDLYRKLTNIRISPEEFQMCLQNPAPDNSYHVYLKLDKNMFWARGIAFICALKGLESHFAPKDV